MSLELPRAELLCTRNYIGGEWCEAKDARRFAVS